MSLKEFGVLLAFFRVMIHFLVDDFLNSSILRFSLLLGEVGDLLERKKSLAGEGAHLTLLIILQWF